MVIGIETDRGFCIQACAAAGYRVYAINPLAVARYRDRHHLAGAKSDAGDAKVLADLVSTDRHNHRRIAGDSPEVKALKVFERGHQNLIWARNGHTNQHGLVWVIMPRERIEDVCTAPRGNVSQAREQ